MSMKEQGEKRIPRDVVFPVRPLLRAVPLVGGPAAPLHSSTRIRLKVWGPELRDNSVTLQLGYEEIEMELTEFLGLAERIRKEAQE